MQHKNFIPKPSDPSKSDEYGLISSLPENKWLNDPDFGRGILPSIDNYNKKK